MHKIITFTCDNYKCFTTVFDSDVHRDYIRISFKVDLDDEEESNAYTFRLKCSEYLDIRLPEHMIKNTNTTLTRGGNDLIMVTDDDEPSIEVIGRWDVVCDSCDAIQHDRDYSTVILKENDTSIIEQFDSFEFRRLVISYHETDARYAIGTHPFTEYDNENTRLTLQDGQLYIFSSESTDPNRDSDILYNYLLSDVVPIDHEFTFRTSQSRLKLATNGKRHLEFRKFNFPNDPIFGEPIKEYRAVLTNSIMENIGDDLPAQLLTEIYDIYILS